MESESKKQASRFKREMRKIRANLDGVRKMTRLPGAVVVVDAKKEYLALREARKLNIPTVGILDTDSDPDTVDVAIPANDDSIRAVEIILNELADAVAIGKTMVSVRQQDVSARPRRVRSRRPAMARADGAEGTAVATVSEEAAEEEEAPAPESNAPLPEPEQPSAGA
jgi:small subunit ribosomal protein S2